MMQKIVLVGEHDNRLGTLSVPPSCAIINYGGSTFVRTDKKVRLRPSHTHMAIVFDHAEVYHRNYLDPL